MVKKRKKNTSQGNELLENPEALAKQFSKTEQFLKTNRNLVFIIGGSIALVVAAVFIYKNYMSSQNEIAQIEMMQAVYYFESDSLNLALNGDGNSYGFLDVIDEYGATKAGNLAKFYAGTIYLKNGSYEEAIDYLGQFGSSDLLVQARAYALMGDAYMELADYESGADYYSRAANHKPHESFTPVYLMKAALAYERLAQYDKAVACYDTIIEEYASAREYQDARKHKARIQGIEAMI